VRKIYFTLSVCVGFAIGHAASFAISDEPTQQNQEQDSPNQTESLAQPVEAYAPLTLKQKYLYSLDRVAGPSRLIGFAAHAGLDQLWKKPEQWGSEPESFGYRIASNFGDHLLKETIGFGVRAADGEDPRYFRSGHGGGLKRTAYAIGHTFWVHKDDGSMMPAYSLFVADCVTPALDQLWRPGPFTGLREVRAGTLGMAGNVLMNVWQEFWPDVRQKLPSKWRQPLARVLPNN
jgi:hypothetical protein